MYHSITFTNEDGVSKNTWDDWHLIPSERPSIAYPSPKTQITQIAHVHGIAYDATEIQGFLSYGLSSGSWAFVVSDQTMNWVDLYSELLNYMHGHRVRIVLEDDPNHYYEGRVKVNWQTGASFSSVSIEYSINKYLYEEGD